MTINEIWLGDSVELSKSLESESIDLIFTDPVYENETNYENLANLAYRLLKWDRPLLVWCSRRNESKLKDIFKDCGFTWQWSLQYVVIGKPTRLAGYHLFTWSTPCLWFNKGKFQPEPWIPDTYVGGYGKKFSSYGNHKWAKGYEVSLCWVNSFSKFGDLVFDPFCGSGTVPYVAKKLGRNYIGIEKNQKYYNLAVEQLQSIEIQAFPYVYQPDSLF